MTFPSTNPIVREALLSAHRHYFARACPGLARRPGALALRGVALTSRRKAGADFSGIERCRRFGRGKRHVRAFIVADQRHAAR